MPCGRGERGGRFRQGQVHRAHPRLSPGAGRTRNRVSPAVSPPSFAPRDGGRIEYNRLNTKVPEETRQNREENRRLRKEGKLPPDNFDRLMARVTGTEPQPCASRLKHAGSSPRVRGTPQSYRERHGGRFIPARAGNTAQEQVAATTGAVHPRACGEHGRLWPHVQQRAGSSPRVRGTRPAPLRGRIGRRFIPARAGNTPATRCRTMHSGSSPRVRGTPAQRIDCLRVARFIPARAGNTGRPRPVG